MDSITETECRIPVLNFHLIITFFLVFVRELCISYSGACGFLDKAFLLTKKLLNQGLLVVKLKINRYGISVAQMTTYMFATEYQWHRWPRICSLRNISGTYDHVNVRYGISVAQMTTHMFVAEYQWHRWPRICSICRNHNPSLHSSFITDHCVFT